MINLNKTQENKVKNEDIQQPRKISQENEKKNQEPTYSKFPQKSIRRSQLSK